MVVTLSELKVAEYLTTNVLPVVTPKNPGENDHGRYDRPRLTHHNT